jgi:predicted nuclease of restriction endonuclease-like (RecB) superfamily
VNDNSEMNKQTLHNKDILFSKVAEIIILAQASVVRAVNLTMVYAYYNIGKYIVEDEQQGKQRAGYGKAILKELSEKLTERFGRGYSVQNLEYMRNFFLVYSVNPNSQTVSGISQNNNSECIINSQTLSGNSDGTILSVPESLHFKLSWSHYLVLILIENPDERHFYELETAKQNWTVRQLRRQYSSSLYERLALSRNKEEVMRLANEGQQIEKPTDILKTPFTLEFLGLEEKTIYTESDLEEAIISKLQQFLLELGKGFLFEARQKRFTFNGKHYFVDLVFYNRLLQCYVVIDLKVDELTHQDLGQMQMYVNYYDRNEKQPYEKPTIGILLAKEQDNALVELTLPKEANIYSAEYKLYLPDKELLRKKLMEWTDELF